MAVFETWLDQDLKKPVRIQYLSGNLFSQDNMGNLIGVNVTDDGAPATLGGSVSANVIRADGTTVAVDSGVLSGNRASVTLPQAAYAVPGVITVVIKITSGTDVTTLAAVVTTVYRSSTDTIVDPGTIIPSIQTLISQIETAVASIPSDYSSLWTTLAPAYSTSATYAVGQYVTYNGGLYRCTTAITSAESWTAAHWTAAKVGNDLSDLKSAFADVTEKTKNIWDVVYRYGNGWIQGTFLTPLPAGTYTLTINVSSDLTTHRVALLDQYEYGSAHVITYKSVTENDTDTTWTFTTSVQAIALYVFAGSSVSGSAGHTITINKIQLETGSTATYYIKPVIAIDSYARNLVQMCLKSGDNIATETANISDFDNAIGNRIYNVSTNQARTIANSPYNSAFYLLTYTTKNNVQYPNTLPSEIQIAIPYSGGDSKYAMRNKSSGGVFTEWVHQPKATGELQPNGEDQTDEIVSRLTEFGICKLQKGTYIVHGALMPEGSILQGYGEETVVKLSGTAYGHQIPSAMSSEPTVSVLKVMGESDGILPAGNYHVVANISTTFTGTDYSRIYFQKTDLYGSSGVIAYVNADRDTNYTFDIFLNEPVHSVFICSGPNASSGVGLTVNSFKMELMPSAIVMNKNCTVKDITLTGSDTDISLTDTIGDRNGISWLLPENQFGIISGCRIRNFSGAGILLQDTGTDYDYSPAISDCHIYKNCVGVYIRRNSEFIKIANCGITHNYYGIINRGGNNNIANCGIDGNVIGITIDEAEGSNNGHGAISNCTINHSDVAHYPETAGGGYGLIINGTGRELVTGCNFYYSKIRLYGTNGNVINGCGFGSRSGIEIENGSMNLICNCCMKSAEDVPITVTNNQNVKVVNCWTRAGVEVVPTVTA